jgi:hypothetical protein
VPACSSVNIAQKDIGTCFDQELDDSNMAGVTREMQWSPKMGASSKVQVKGSGASVYTATLGLLVGWNMIACPIYTSFIR